MWKWLDMLTLLPEQASTYAADVDRLFYVIYYITFGIFLLVTLLLVWFVIKYRAQPGRAAIYSHGNNALELIWTAVPSAVFIILFLISASTWANIKIFKPKGDLDVRVVAKQFAWEYHYPGPDGKHGSDDDVQIDGDLYVPVNKIVTLRLQGTDVIHSYFVPVMRLKQDVLPGREIVAWFEATKTGKFEVPCAELCGPGHSGMKGWLHVLSEEDYQKWAEENAVIEAAAAPTPAPTPVPASESQKPSEMAPANQGDAAPASQSETAPANQGDTAPASQSGTAPANQGDTAPTNQSETEKGESQQ